MCFDTLFGQEDVAASYGSGGVIWDWQRPTGPAGGRKKKKQKQKNE